VDKFHDRAYDGVSSVPRRVRGLRHPRNRRKMSRRSNYDDDESAPPPPGTYDGVVNGRPGYPPGDGFAAGEAPYAKSSAGSRSGRDRGIDNDTYDESYGSRDYTARDGYRRDAYSDMYEERGQNYGDRPVRGEGYARGYQQPAIAYGTSDRRSRHYDDDDDEEDDSDDYDDRRRVDKYRGRRDRDSDRSRSRSGKRSDKSKSRGNSSDRGKEGNSEAKKWAATLAGAAAGGFAGHKAKKDNWMPTAIGAIVGGLVAREAEKEVYKRKGHRKEEREMEKRSH